MGKTAGAFFEARSVSSKEKYEDRLNYHPDEVTWATHETADHYPNCYQPHALSTYDNLPPYVPCVEPTTDEERFVHHAALGHLKELKALSHVDASYAHGPQKRTALHFAANNGWFHVVKYLVEERKVSPLLQRDDGRYALHLAAQGGYIDIVKYFVEKCGVDPSVRNRYGASCWHETHDESLRAYLEAAGATYTSNDSRNIQFEASDSEGSSQSSSDADSEPAAPRTPEKKPKKVKGAKKKSKKASSSGGGGGGKKKKSKKK